MAFRKETVVKISPPRWPDHVMKRTRVQTSGTAVTVPIAPGPALNDLFEPKIQVWPDRWSDPDPGARRGMAVEGSAALEPE